MQFIVVTCAINCSETQTCRYQKVRQLALAPTPILYNLIAHYVNQYNYAGALIEARSIALFVARKT